MESAKVALPNRTSLYKKWFQVAVVICCAFLSIAGTLDRVASRNHSELWQRAIVTFAVARTLNAVISTVQGTEVALQPAGVGVTLTPGQVLDPVNDIVERFSWIMLGASISLGIQKVALEMGEFPAFSYFLLLLGVAWLVLLFLESNSAHGLRRVREITFGAFLCVALVRLTIPAALILNEQIYRAFLSSQYISSSAEIQATSGEILNEHEIATESDETEGSDWWVFSDWLKGAQSSLDFGARLDDLKAKTLSAIDHLIQLSVIFVLQTALIPIFLIWFLFILLKRVVLTCFFDANIKP